MYVKILFLLHLKDKKIKIFICTNISPHYIYIYIYIYIRVTDFISSYDYLNQSAGAAEYFDCISAEG